MKTPGEQRRSNLLGEYLRSLRESKGLPIRKVAAGFDRADSWIHSLETGKHSTDLKSLYSLISFLEGDFCRALCYLCIDEGVPEREAQAATGISDKTLSH
jgi:transcriptional regulator with XRE-family HTH domain